MRMITALYKSNNPKTQNLPRTLFSVVLKRKQNKDWDHIPLNPSFLSFLVALRQLPFAPFVLFHLACVVHPEEHRMEIFRLFGSLSPPLCSFLSLSLFSKSAAGFPSFLSFNGTQTLPLAISLFIALC